MLPKVPLLVAASIVALTAGAGAGEYPTGTVKMFDRAPTVEELRVVVRPDLPIRTRAIRLSNASSETAKRPAPLQSASYAAAPSQAAPAQQPSPVRPTPASAPAAIKASAPAPGPSGGSEDAVVSVAAAPVPAPVAFGFNIRFAFNSAEIAHEFFPHIDAVGALLKQEGSIDMLVEGHTDATGDDAYNEDLSLRRANAVRQYLVKVHGVEPRRLVARGLGERHPLVNDPNDGVNRRVEFSRSQ